MNEYFITLLILVLNEQLKKIVIFLLSPSGRVRSEGTYHQTSPG